MIEVDFIDHTGNYETLEEPLTQFVNDFENEVSVKLEPCLVELVIETNEGIRQLNRNYRDKDTPTDVLSFPDGDIDDGEEILLLGSIVISAEKAEEQAAEIGHSSLEEIKFLTLHGMLHILGYDHESDNGEMITYQKELKQKLQKHFPGVLP